MSSTSRPGSAQQQSVVPFLDTPDTYGHVSRVLHWGMALLFLIQFASSAARQFAEDSQIEQLLWPLHSEVGTALFLLIFLRGVWGFLNLKQRPPHAPGLWGLAARIGHSALYILMLAVPLLALLRSYGSGRGIELLGIEIVARTGVERAAWMDTLGDALHGNLGWVFFGLVAGHIFAALFHPRLEGSAVMPRMGVSRGPGTISQTSQSSGSAIEEKQDLSK